MDGMMPAEAGLDEVFRAIATLQVSFERVAKNQDVFKLELRGLVPRVDALGARIEALTADVRQMSDRLHTANNLVTRALDESAAVYQEQRTLDRALDLFEANSKVKTAQLEQTQGTLERMIEVLETRVQRLRDSVVPVATEERHG
jgi:chromosome segregation ATPase